MRSNVVSIDPDVAAEEKRSKAFAACMKEARALKPGDDRGVIALLVKPQRSAAPRFRRIC